jgi:hypothetical protein
MKKSRLLGAVFACLLVMSFSTSAALIDNGNTTLDTATGLEWLDLTLTQGWSIDQIVIQGFGGYAAQGYLHATIGQICGLFGALGDSMSGCTDLAGANVILVQPSTAATLVSLLGNTALPAQALGAYGLFISSQNPSLSGLACVEDNNGSCTGIVNSNVATLDIGCCSTAGSLPEFGNWLVRPHAVPVPPAVWLFGSGLLGLIGVARRKVRV